MDTNFEQVDFGALKPYLEDDDVTDISYDNGGQIHLRTLSKGIFRVDNKAIDDAFMEKLAFQCSNVMGKTFNMAHPFLDAESAELRLAFIHDSVSRNGIACVVRKTPAKIRLQKDKIVADKYVELDIVDFLEQCVLGHCNIIVSGETGSGKTELIKYLASKIAENEKVITIEDTLELHLDKIFPHRDIVSMKTNNIASYTDILEACMRQNPKWILLSEVRSAEAVMAIRNSISSGHYILSTIHADKASSIPNRMYSLLETNQDLDQFMSSICRYIQIGIYVRGYTDKVTHNFKREIAEVTEFYVTNDTNEAKSNVIYRKGADGKVIRNNPSPYLIDYLEVQGVFLPKELKNIAGDSSNKEDTINIQSPLSESEISDDQTVTFSSDGAIIEPKQEDTSLNEVNPIEIINSGKNFDGNVSEIVNSSFSSDGISQKENNISMINNLQNVSEADVVSGNMVSSLDDNMVNQSALSNEQQVYPASSTQSPSQTSVNSSNEVANENTVYQSALSNEPQVYPASSMQSTAQTSVNSSNEVANENTVYQSALSNEPQVYPASSTQSTAVTSSVYESNNDDIEHLI